jgi:hypothetical protein
MAEKELGYKRINFFKGFLTTEKDWNDSENYHVAKRKLHNQMLHAPGVVPGYGGELLVQARERAELSVEVSPGYAIDGSGSDIFLWETQIKSINPADYKLPQTIYLVLKYVEELSDFIAYKENLEYKGHRRLHEVSKVEWTSVEPNVESEVELARINLEEGARKITDPKNPLDPAANEIDLRFVPLAGVVGNFMSPLVTMRLQKVFNEMLEVYGFVHREKKVTTAGDTFQATVIMEMLMATQNLDLRNIFGVLDRTINHQWLMVNEVEAKIPVISAKKDFAQYKKNIEILKGLIVEKKRSAEYLDSILQYQEKACEALRKIFAKEMKPGRKPAEIKPDDAAAGAGEATAVRADGLVSLDVGGDWERIKVQSGPFEKDMEVEGVVWTKIDEIDILDRDSEEAHDYGIHESRDSYRSRQKLKYPDGTVVEDGGMAHEGGYAEFVIKNVTPGKDVAIIRRMDYVYGEYEAELFVNGKKTGILTCPGEDRKYRWRNWPWVIPGEFIETEEVRIRQVNITADRDINMFHLWFYQSLG